MTGQISDRVVHRGVAFDLVGVDGSGLFDPADHGVWVFPMNTACYRGFYCRYLTSDGSLFLDTVHLALDEADAASAARGEGPTLYGRVPKRYTEYAYSADTQAMTMACESEDFVIEGMREPVPFTGRLLLGADFILELYVHMGFQAPYTFRDVRELVFEGGKLVAESDLSAQMAELRAKVAADPSAYGELASQTETEAWVRACFRLDDAWRDVE